MVIILNGTSTTRRYNSRHEGLSGPMVAEMLLDHVFRERVVEKEGFVFTVVTR